MSARKKPRSTPKKKLYWCTTDDGDEDWFIIATSARQARRLHEDLEGYDVGDAEAELVATLPDRWQHHSVGWPRISTSLLSDCGGVRVAYRPAEAGDVAIDKLRAQMDVVTEAWSFGDRVYTPGDIVANAAARLRITSSA
jgi:hypothetical protein